MRIAVLGAGAWGTALAIAFAPDDAEIAAVAKLIGAVVDPAKSSALPRTTPAKAARADCVADLGLGDFGAARAAGDGWSLCHLAAVLAK